MKVLSAPGTQCPKESNPRDYIDDQTPQEVPDTTYYIRLVMEGSLVKVDEAQPVSEKGGKK